MTTDGHRQSATIYQFPTDAVRRAAGRFHDAKLVPIITPPQLPAVEFGSGWYHDEAIQDDQTRKN
jgi:hypothetical protein